MGAESRGKRLAGGGEEYDAEQGAGEETGEVGELADLFGEPSWETQRAEDRHVPAPRRLGDGPGDGASNSGRDDSGSEGGGGLLPEPTVVPRERDPRRGQGADGGLRIPIPSTEETQRDNEKVAAQMKAAAVAMGVEVSREARVGGGDIDEWEEALNFYLNVLQRKMGEAEDGEGLRLTLTTDPEIEAADMARIAHFIRNPFLERDPGKGEAAFSRLVEALYDEVVGLSVLAPLWRDPTITEIIVDGWQKIYFERGGELFDTNLKFRSARHLESVARNLAEVVSDRSLSKTNPLVTARLPDSRVAFVYGDVAGDGVYVAIRKHHEKLSWSQLLAGRAMTPEMRDFLAKCVEARVNILISGGTGAGKTTIINAVSSFIPDNERVITIEDSYELDLRNRYWAKLSAKGRASQDDTVEVSVSDLLRQSLRMRPDRIVVGEVRDGSAAAALLEASNTGHDGTLTTLHANSGWDAINARLPGLYQIQTGAPSEVARAEVSRAFELVVHVARRQGRRFVSEISEVGQLDRISGDIYLRKLYEGTLGPEEVPVFRKLANVATDGDLARKFEEAGIPVESGNLYSEARDDAMGNGRSPYENGDDQAETAETLNAASETRAESPVPDDLGEAPREDPREESGEETR